VTGVQTCALPISETSLQLQLYELARYREEGTAHWIGIWPLYRMSVILYM
jgi:hypothetical protein